MHEYIPIEPPRPLSPSESGILERILSADFPGSHDLRQQIRSVQVSAKCRSCPSIVFEITDKAAMPKAEVERTIPIEAEGNDLDGVKLHILIFIKGGYLDEMEIFREDLGKIQRLPLPENLEVLALY